MSEREALCRTIVANPEDDTPRLVYADWLQENGDPARSELIRVQCRLEGMPPGHPEYADLKIDEQCLLDAHATEWLQAEGLPDELNWYSVSEYRRLPVFVRGFPAWPSLEIQDAPEFGATLEKASNTTFVRDVELYLDDDEDSLSLLHRDEWAPFTGLTFTGNPDSTGLEEARLLARSPRFSNLRKLHHMASPAGDQWLDEYASSKTLRHVREMCLWFGRVTPAGVRRFCESTLARNLTRLDVRGLRDDTLTALAQARLPKLRTLRLIDRYRYNNPALSELVRSPGFPALCDLAFDGTYCGPRNLQALVNPEKSVPLTELDLSQGSKDAGALRKMFTRNCPGGLRSLRVNGRCVDDAALIAWSASPGVSELRRLNIGQTPAGGEGIRALLTSDHLGRLASLALRRLPQKGATGHATSELLPALQGLSLPALRHLDLSGQPLGVRGARALAKNPGLTRLRSLTLARCGIGEKGFEALVASPHLRGLEYFIVDQNRIGKAATALADHSNLPALRRCDLRQNNVEARVQRKLRGRAGVLV